MKLIFQFLSIFLFATSAFAETEDIKNDLKTLDKALEHRERYAEKRKELIENQKEESYKGTDMHTLFSIQQDLSNQYLAYQLDSALHYAFLCAETVRTSQDNVLHLKSQLQLAKAQIHSGMYLEGAEVLQTIHKENLSSELKQEYYTVSANLYRYLSSYLNDGSVALSYDLKRAAYQDSIMQVIPRKDANFDFLQAEIHLNRGEVFAAQTQFLSLLEKHSIQDRSFAAIAYTLSKTFQKQGNTLMQKQYLIQSATSDVLGGVKEHASLRELALLMFEEGEVSRAYNYMKIAMEDALFANARIRSYEILNIFPVIDHAYTELQTRNRKRMMIFLILITILSLVLFSSLYLTQQKRKQLKTANLEIQKIFDQLVDVNQQLKERSAETQIMNQKLAHSVDLQEEYIAKYLKLCSDYIGKIDGYRKMLHKKVRGGISHTDLINVLKSKDHIDAELKSFYHDFDEAFLTLYPNFVAQFNDLLKEDEKVHPKKGDLLSTELRIFALIRLGITESPSIAEFLRYSLTTIYNYRTRIRNKSLGDRDLFETSVMKISKD